jgi:hypothetical protein
MWPGLVGGRLESPVKVEAAKGISYCRPMLGAVNLLSKSVYTHQLLRIRFATLCTPSTAFSKLSMSGEGQTSS